MPLAGWYHQPSALFDHHQVYRWYDSSNSKMIFKWYIWGAYRHWVPTVWLFRIGTRLWLHTLSSQLHHSRTTCLYRMHLDTDEDSLLGRFSRVTIPSSWTHDHDTSNDGSRAHAGSSETKWGYHGNFNVRFQYWKNFYIIRIPMFMSQN